MHDRLRKAFQRGPQAVFSWGKDQTLLYNGEGGAERRSGNGAEAVYAVPEKKEVFMDEREELRRELIRTIVRMGYPASFGEAIADNLRTEKTMRRMLGYLAQAGPRSAEEIADEMLAIMEDRQRWIRKKEAEYYNSRYNELLYYGLRQEDE